MEAAATPTPQPEVPPAPARTAAPAAAARPDGPVAAMLLATGIGSLVLAILVIVAEANESFATSLAYSERVGPLSGKTIWAVVAFLVSWGGLTALLRKREVDLRTIAIVSAVLIGLALIGTFSPFFELFAPD
jgi:hypothetical protein